MHADGMFDPVFAIYYSSLAFRSLLSIIYLLTRRLLRRPCNCVSGVFYGADLVTQYSTVIVEGDYFQGFVGKVVLENQSLLSANGGPYYHRKHELELSTYKRIWKLLYPS